MYTKSHAVARRQRCCNNYLISPEYTGTLAGCLTTSEIKNIITVPPVLNINYYYSMFSLSLLLLSEANISCMLNLAISENSNGVLLIVHGWSVYYTLPCLVGDLLWTRNCTAPSAVLSIRKWRTCRDR